MIATTPLRSWLFVPGDRPDRFPKALRSGADVVIVDLEDAVPSATKEEARSAVLGFLTRRPAGGPGLAVRINAFATLLGLKDLGALAEAPVAPDFIILPKVEDASTPRIVGEMLENAGSPTRLVALIETPRAVAAAAEVAQSTARLEAVMFGAADYSAALGRTAEELRPDHARAVIANAAAIGGLLAIDTPFFAIDQPSALEDQCRAAHAVGFAAKAAIHPAQVETINLAFTPTDRARAEARRILAATAGGAALMDGRMVDAAMVRWAERTLGAGG